MHRLRSAVRYIGLLATISCASMQAAAGLDPAAPSSVAVALGLRGTEAVPEIVARATRGGYQVASSSPALVTIGPVSIKEDPNVRMQFSVAVVADSAVVRGTLTDPMRGLRDYPIRGNTSGRAAWGWRELTRLADALR